MTPVSVVRSFAFAFLRRLEEFRESRPERDSRIGGRRVRTGRRDSSGVLLAPPAAANVEDSVTIERADGQTRYSSQLLGFPVGLSRVDGAAPRGEKLDGLDRLLDEPADASLLNTQAFPPKASHSARRVQF